MSGQPKTRVSFPRLDGLRALCFVPVFFTHGFYTTDPAILGHPAYHFFKGILFASGGLGVNMFFVLSGFLITFLLLREREATGTLNVPHFWLRRVLRIWPLYYACVLFGFLVFPVLKSALGQVPHETANPWYYLFFAGNFDVLYNGLPDSSNLGVLWSIAVEEQFYLVWPVLLFALPRRSLPVVFTLILLCSMGFNLVMRDTLTNILHTLSCMGDLAVGAMAAWLCSRPGGLERVARWPVASVVTIHVLLFALFLTYEPLARAGLSLGLLRALFALNAAAVIMAQSAWQGNAFMMPDRPWLNYLGRISYGLYCLHPIGILTAVHVLRLLHLDDRVWQILVLQPSAAFLVTVLLAATSYRYYESPFLRLKSRFATIRR